MSDTAANLENLAQTLQQLAPGLLFWSGVGFLDDVPDALRTAVGEEWGPETVEGYLSYLSFSKSRDDRRLTVVLAAPCPPDQLAALQTLLAAGLLACVVILERRKPVSWGGWTVPAPLSPLMKKHCATGSYLEELGFHEGGWVDWESTEKDHARLLEALETACEHPPGYLVVACQDNDREYEVESSVWPQATPSRITANKAGSVDTVYGRFARELPDLVAPTKLLWLDESAQENPKALEQHVKMFSTLERGRPGRPVLVIASAVLPALYAELRDWCCDRSREAPIVIVHGSGIPTGRERGPGGLTDGHLLLSIPELTLSKPADEAQARCLFQEAAEREGAACLVFSQAPAVGLQSQNDIMPGRWRCLREGKDVSILALGSTVYPSLLAAESLQVVGLQVAVYDLRYRRPMDRELLAEATNYPLVVTVEEGPESSSFASHIISARGSTRKVRLSVEVAELSRLLTEEPYPLSLESFGLHAEGIARSIKGALNMGPTGL